jgi:aminoglycoside phosphotransferase (APT) family kinase protein
MSAARRCAPAPPPPDLPVDRGRIERVCARLRAEQGVDLARLRWSIGAAPVGEGWDNVLWPVGTLEDRPLVLRVARRASARPLLLRELVVLRHLGTAGTPLPMRLPVPLATGEDAVLMPWYEGIVAAEADTRLRQETAQDLAEMLAAVHSLPAPGIAVNPVRGVPLRTRAGAFAEDLDRARLPAPSAQRARDLWQAGLAAPDWTGPGLLLHGDPHPGNVVLPPPADGGPAVLIDWGDTTRGDPASDLGSLLLHDPTPAPLSAYREAAAWSGSEDDRVWDALVARAWAWAARMALSLVTAYPLGHGLGRTGHRLLLT